MVNRFAGESLPCLMVVIVAGLLLAGCKSHEEQLALQAQQDHQACADMGYEKGTPLYLQCRQMVLNSHAAATAETNAQMNGFGNGLQRAGAALQNIDRPMSQTNCNRTFTGFNCTTF